MYPHIFLSEHVWSCFLKLKFEPKFKFEIKLFKFDLWYWCCNGFSTYGHVSPYFLSGHVWSCFLELKFVLKFKYEIKLFKFDLWCWCCKAFSTFGHQVWPFISLSLTWFCQSCWTRMCKLSHVCASLGHDRYR